MKTKTNILNVNKNKKNRKNWHIFCRENVKKEAKKKARTGRKKKTGKF